MALALPFVMGARGDGCAANSQSPAPNVEGTWAITYDDTLDVTITIGGAVYERTLGAAGGVVEITHDGHPLTFDLDCARPDILCPSEAWPQTVTVRQQNTRYEHRMIVTLPTQSCAGDLVDPDPASCGPGTPNEECQPVCDGDVIVSEVDRFGVIGEAGDSFRLYLGAGVATNGVNCALLAASVADADLVTVGSADGGDWNAVAMEAGLVTTGYAGGCLWAGDPDMDGDLEALVLGATVVIRTGFTGARVP
ncbi:MAG: hypothetical protein D6689_22420 [Deltaproteobacteria bacterium]|nr:MAG: hypothetical protein D6689_22420 [Deltaproteobacteria bacterium]